MAALGGPPPDAVGLILTGLFWLLPVLVSQSIPAPFEGPMSWIEWGLGTAGIVGGIVVAARD
jgi:hypothetical protein